MDLFRMRCYLASLQGGELPNPKSLLAAASRPSKLALGRLGILSVSSFHALVSSPGRTVDAPLCPAHCPQLCCDLTQGLRGGGDSLASLASLLLLPGIQLLVDSCYMFTSAPASVCCPCALRKVDSPRCGLNGVKN